MFRHVSCISRIAVVLAVAIAAGARPVAQANDPLLGGWVLDRAKSTFSGAVPDRLTMKFEKIANGIRHSTETVQADILRRLQYTFQIDGKDYPADTQMAVNTVSFKRIDANTLERTGKYRGQIVETTTYQVSGDGKVLTAIRKGTIDGADLSSTQVFTRQ